MRLSGSSYGYDFRLTFFNRIHFDEKTPMVNAITVWK